MKSLLVAALMVSASAAQASIGVTIRSDLVAEQNYENRNKEDIQGTTVFTPAFARMNYMGKVGSSDLTFVYDLTGTNVNDSVYALYLAKKMDAFTFTAGRIAINQGGFESAQGDAADTYQFSLANGGTGPYYFNSSSNIVTSLANGSGAGVAYTMGDHKIELQALNQRDAAYSSTNTTSGQVTVAEKRRQTVGLAYMGSFGDVGVSASFFNSADDRRTVSGLNGAWVSDSQTDLTFTNLGVSYKMDALNLTLDYLDNVAKPKATGSYKDQTTSTVLMAKYDMGMYIPQLKIESSTHKENEETTDADKQASFARTGLTAALEVKPMSDEDFRYHVAYVSVADKFNKTADTSTTNETVNWSKMVVGIKYTGDFLK